MALATPPASHNYTVLVAEVTDDGYDTLVADIWVGVVLTLMVLSCVCCVCSCLLYHKFQQWKRSVLAARGPPPGETAEGPYGAGGPGADLESLPSYTIVSGLPSYEEALDQLRRARERRESLKSAAGDLSPAPAYSTIAAPAPPAANSPIKISVAEFFQGFFQITPVTLTPYGRSVLSATIDSETFAGTSLGNVLSEPTGSPITHKPRNICPRRGSSPYPYEPRRGSIPAHLEPRRASAPRPLDSRRGSTPRLFEPRRASSPLALDPRRASNHRPLEQRC